MNGFRRIAEKKDRLNGLAGRDGSIKDLLKSFVKKRSQIIPSSALSLEYTSIRG